MEDPGSARERQTWGEAEMNRKVPGRGANASRSPIGSIDLCAARRSPQDPRGEIWITVAIGLVAGTALGSRAARSSMRHRVVLRWRGRQGSCSCVAICCTPHRTWRGDPPMTAHPASPSVSRDLSRSCRRCPRCDGSDVARSRRRSAVEGLMRIVNVYPFRCLDCYHRFFGWWR
jgi:hypothetical protein